MIFNKLVPSSMVHKADEDDTYFDGYADVNIKIDSLLALAEFSTDLFLDCVNACQDILSPCNIRQLELSEMYLKELKSLYKWYQDKTKPPQRYPKINTQ